MLLHWPDVGRRSRGGGGGGGLRGIVDMWTELGKSSPQPMVLNVFTIELKLQLETMSIQKKGLATRLKKWLMY